MKRKIIFNINFPHFFFSSAKHDYISIVSNCWHFHISSFIFIGKKKQFFLIKRWNFFLTTTFSIKKKLFKLPQNIPCRSHPILYFFTRSLPSYETFHSTLFNKVRVLLVVVVLLNLMFYSTGIKVLCSFTVLRTHFYECCFSWV